MSAINLTLGYYNYKKKQMAILSLFHPLLVMKLVLLGFFHPADFGDIQVFTSSVESGFYDFSANLPQSL